MEVEWELREAGPPVAESTVSLLSGGMCGAGSYAEAMAEPAVATTRLLAATLPGHAGTPPPAHRGERRAQRLCQADVPTWVVHAEQDDCGLTDDERRTVEACPNVRL